MVFKSNENTHRPSWIHEYIKYQVITFVFKNNNDLNILSLFKM